MCTEFKNITNLIHKELSGNITEEDRGLLNDWKNSDTKNSAILEQYKRVWDLSHAPERKFDSNFAYNKMLLKLEEANNEPIVKELPPRSLGIFYKIAAMLLLVLGAWFVFNNLQQDTYTANENYVRVDLKDGSHIWLSPQSKLTVKSLREDSRNVSLDGEAYFNIAKNIEAPFKIHTQSMDVEVLGTVFLVNGHDNEVAVKEGKVKVAAGDNIVFLKSKEKSNLQDGKLQVSNSDNAQAKWLTQSLAFDNELLSTVLSEIELKYDVNFEIAENVDLKDCRFSSSSLSSNSFDQILETLRLTFEMDVKQIDNNILLISSLNCN
ncbi:MAG: FecR family protein [Saprospiraceae bacterium]